MNHGKGDIGWSNTRGKNRYYVTVTLKKKPWTYHARISLNADNKEEACRKVKREYGERYKYNATKWYPY